MALATTTTVLIKDRNRQITISLKNIRVPYNTSTPNNLAKKKSKISVLLKRKFQNSQKLKKGFLIMRNSFKLVVVLK